MLFAQKREKENKAQQLLDSIDNYLLNELGIIIPKVDTELRNRIFFRFLSYNRRE